MKFFIRFFLVAILLLALSACNNGAATTETSNETHLEKVSETKEKKSSTSSDVIGYWYDQEHKDYYYSISKKDDIYTVNALDLGGKIELKQSNIENNVVNVTVESGQIHQPLSPGEKATIRLSENKSELTLDLGAEKIQLSKLEDTNNVEPVELVGHWISDKDYLNITKNGNTISIEIVEEGQLMSTLVEISDVIGKRVYGVITKGLEDEDLGMPFRFMLSDDKTKLALERENEFTKTDMSREDFEEQLTDTE